MSPTADPHRRRARLAFAAALSGLALAPAAAPAADGGFAGDAQFPVPRPSSLAVGDFNSHGAPDLAAVSAALGKVVLLLPTASGKMAEPPPVDAGNRPHLVQVADFDRDGNDDLTVTNRFDHEVTIRLGNGDKRVSAALADNAKLIRAPRSIRRRH